MKLKTLAGLCAGALIFASGQAMAADVESVAYKTNWTGFRAGIAGGYGLGHADMSAIVQGISEDGSTDLSGGMIGGLLGYDYELGNGFVMGLVGDMSWSGISGDGCIHPAGISCSTSKADMNVDLNWLATARLRAGLAVDNFLIYGTGGAALGGVDVSLNSPFGNGSDTQTHIGWALGAGVEYRLSDPVSIGLEYLYVDLGKQSYDFAKGNAHGDVDLDTQLLRATLQWRF